MSTLKICCKCEKAKKVEDFYQFKGDYRTECKACTIKRNVIYQRKMKVWKYRDNDNEARKVYCRKYYQKNKEKFAKYRADFIKRHPEYYKKYFRKQKEKK